MGSPRFTQQFARSALGLTLAVGLAFSGCAPSVAEPTRGLAVSIRKPLVNSPFDDPAVAFVRLTVEGPDLKDNTYQTTKPYTPGMAITGPEVPYGPARQVRVELLPRGVNGEPVLPPLGLGRTKRQTVKQGESYRVHAYVTKTNAFSPAVPNDLSTVQTQPSLGGAVVAAGDADVFIAGGTSLIPGSTDPFDPKSWGPLSNRVSRYDVDLREVDPQGGPAPTTLSTGRAFMATTTGVNGLVVFSGGYADTGAGPVPSGLMEYRDPVSGEIKVAPAVAPGGKPQLQHLSVPRAHHTITPMFANGDYFIVAGGVGPDGKALDSWELWHPQYGISAVGSLSAARSHHAAAFIPANDGGFLVLFGGENDQGTLNTWEVIRMSPSLSLIASRGSQVTTCCVGATCYTQRPDKNGVVSTECSSRRSEKGFNLEYLWEPKVYALEDAEGRTLPSVLRVDDPSGLSMIYIVGGFSDKKKTKPIPTVSVLKLLQSPAWVTKSAPLLTARGAPLVGWSTVGATRGQVIVTGGIGADGKTVASGEVLSYDAAGDEIIRTWSSNGLPDGGRVLGGAVSLSTGQVLFAGGAGTGATGWKTTSSIQLYNPR